MHHDRFDAFTRRAAMRGLAAALLGGMVAGSPVARRAASVLAGGECSGEEGQCCPESGLSCCEGFECEHIDPETGCGVCEAHSHSGNNNDNDNKNKNNNNGNGGNGGNGGNNNGDGIFWPCLIPWFANNPACDGTLESLHGR